MSKVTRFLILFLTLFGAFTLLLPNLAYASPDLTSPYYSKPTAHDTDLSVSSPSSAYDANNASAASFDYDPATSGYFEVKTFNNTATTNPIAFVDFKMRYAADAGGTNEEYKITYQVYNTFDYFDADSIVLGEFNGTGSSPYVDAEDHPTNYIIGWSNETSGDIGFENLPSGVYAITEVILEIDVWTDNGSATSGEVFIWDQSANAYASYSFTYPGTKPADGVYQTIDVSARITTKSEANAFKIYFENSTTSASHKNIVDHSRLKVTVKSIPEVLQDWTGSAYGPATRVWMNQPEPFDGVWDWDDIAGIHVKVQTKTGSGGASVFDEYEVWVSVYAYRRSTVFVDPSSLINPSSPFSIDVNISNVDDLYGWEFTLYYNNTILNASSYSEGTFLSSVQLTWFAMINFTDNYNATHGIVWLTCTMKGPVPGATGSGTLASVTFNVNGGASGTTPLDLDDTKLIGNENSNKRLTYMVHDTTDGSVTIPPVAVPEFPLGAALEIALVGVIIYIWWQGKRKQPPKVAQQANASF